MLLNLSKNLSFNRKLSTLIINKFETVLHIKLNRTDQRNCLNYELVNNLVKELNNFEEDKNLKTVIVSGSGGNFCSGIDLIEINNDLFLKELSQLIQMFPLKKPSVAAIEGYATCVGLQLMLVFDYKCVEKDAKIFYDEKNHLKLHPYLNQLYPDFNLKELFSIENYCLEKLINLNIITQKANTGCCLGTALDYAKCTEKFSLDSIIHDRNKLLNREINEQNLLKIFNQEDGSYHGAKRFISDKIGIHGQTNVHTINEIFDRWIPETIENDDLKN